MADMTGAIAWRKARACGSGSCVEVMTHNGDVLVRSSREPAGGHLTFTADEWRVFIDGAKNGEFDI